MHPERQPERQQALPLIEISSPSSDIRLLQMTDANAGEVLSGVDNTGEHPVHPSNNFAKEYPSDSSLVRIEPNRAQGMEELHFAIRTKESNAYTGFINFTPDAFSPVAAKRGSGKIDYYIDRDHLDKGFARQAVVLLADYLLHTHGYLKVYAKVTEDNPESGRVLERAGFSRAGQIEEEGELFFVFVKTP